MKKLTILIPLTSYSTEVKKQIEVSLESVKSQTNKDFEICIVLPEEVTLKNKSKLDTLCKKLGVNYTILSNNTDNQLTLINYAFANLESEYISVLTLGDVFNNSFVNTTLNYIDEYSKVDFFVPINIIQKDSSIAGYSNEFLWAYGRNGFYDFEKVKSDNPSIHVLNGITINSKSFQICGGLKASIKHFSFYEFILRCLHKGKKGLVIPKFLYVHTLQDTYTQLQPLEKMFWSNLGKREYMFDFDREVSFGE